MTDPLEQRPKADAELVKQCTKRVKVRQYHITDTSVTPPDMEIIPRYTPKADAALVERCAKAIEAHKYYGLQLAIPYPRGMPYVEASVYFARAVLKELGYEVEDERD